jgi:hypothetical protein
VEICPEEEVGIRGGPCAWALFPIPVLSRNTFLIKSMFYYKAHVRCKYG